MPTVVATVVPAVCPTVYTAVYSALTTAFTTAFTTALPTTELLSFAAAIVASYFTAILPAIGSTYILTNCSANERADRSAIKKAEFLPDFPAVDPTIISANNTALIKSDIHLPAWAIQCALSLPPLRCGILQHYHPSA
jgi:hypothetical protein